MGVRDWLAKTIFKREVASLVRDEITRVTSGVTTRADRYNQARSRNAERVGLMNQYWQNEEDGQWDYSTPHDELMERYRLQPVLRGPVDKVAKIVCACKPTIKLKKGATENETHRRYLEALIEHPYERVSFYTIIFETVVRMKVIGEVFWELVYADEAQLAGAAEDVKRALVKSFLTDHLHYKGSMPTAEHLEGMISKAVAIADRATSQRRAMPVGFRLLAGTVNPILDKHGRFIDPERAYVQIVQSGERAEFGINDVLWMRGPNPIGGAHALPPFETLEFNDDTDQMMQVYVNSLLRNRGELGGVVTIKNPATGAAERLQQTLQTQHKGPENAGRWHVVSVEEDGDTKVEPFSVKPMDVEPESAAKRRAQLAWAVINVPGAKIGFTEEVNKANIEMQDKALMEEEVMPLCGMIAAPFNEFIKHNLGIEAYSLTFSQADLRTAREKIEQDGMKLKQGRMTINDFLTEEVGPDAVVEDGDVRILEIANRVFVFSKDKPARVVTSAGVSVELYQEFAPTGPSNISADQKPPNSGTDVSGRPAGTVGTGGAGTPSGK